MTDATITGLVIAALSTIVALFISLATPLIKLNRTIQKLNDNIEQLNKDTNNINVILRDTKSTIEEHSKWLSIDKKRLDNQSARLKKLDGEIGIEDDSRR